MEDYITEITKNLNKECFKITPDLQVSEDGSTLICGCRFEECALIFTRQDDQWVFQQKLTASDGVAYDRFGTAVSLSSDGSTALVGAPYNSSATGATYVFASSGSTWTQQAKLVASDGVTYDWFGCRFILSEDGTLAQVFNWDNNEYTFTLLDGVWTETTKSKGN